MDKICSKCKVSQALDWYHRCNSKRDGHQSVCKNCKTLIKREWLKTNFDEAKESRRQWRVDNAGKARDLLRAWRKRNPDKVKESNRRWRDKNPGYSARYSAQRKKQDTCYRLASVLRVRLHSALNGKFRYWSAVRDLGCSVYELKRYLEKRFQEGMSWGNHGKWHIDHIVPLSSFNLSDSEQFKKACHYTNLQPLWAKDNLKKSNRITP